MNIVSAFDVVIYFLRPFLFWAAVALAIVAFLDWLVRTRRINPFNPVARFTREMVDPLFKPVERSVVRAGGNPQSAPFWALALAVLGGIVVLSLLGFIRDQFAMAMVASQGGARGVFIQLLNWTFQILRLALLVRVLCSFVRISPYSKWVRWAFVLSEPILAPLRRVIPPLGMVDITPLIAWLLLGLLQGILT